MLYSFARVSAVVGVGMTVQDYYRQGKRSWIRLHEKGGTFHEVPCHHKSEKYLDAYLDGAGIRDQPKSPLFRSTHGRTSQLTEKGLTRVDAFRIVQRRAKAAGLVGHICNNSFRATGITVYLENGGSLETSAHIAAHESPRTTKLYDRTANNITLEELSGSGFDCQLFFYNCAAFLNRWLGGWDDGAGLLPTGEKIMDPPSRERREIS